MKKLIYLAAALLVHASASVAQPSATTIFNQNNILSFVQAGKPQTKTNAINSRIIAASAYAFSPLAGAYILNDSIAYKYSGNRGGDGSAIPKFDTARYIEPSTGMVTRQETVIYDAYDNAAAHAVAALNSNTGNLEVIQKAVYGYNANHLQITDSSFVWSNIVRSFLPRIAVAYTYNTVGKMMTETGYRYDANTQQWVAAVLYQVQYTYDANNNLTEKTFLADNSMGTLQNQAKDIYTYNADNMLTSHVKQEWNHNAWKNTDETYYTLNTNGIVEKQLMLHYNRGTQTMDTTGYQLNNTGANNNITENIYYDYDYNLHTGVKASRSLITYNNFNQIIRIASEEWLDNNHWGTRNRGSIFYYYYETYFPTDVAQLPQQGGTLQLYPVPANNTLNISINWKEAQPYTLTIADMQGRVNMQYNSKNTNETIDVSMLPEGVYNIILKGDKGGAQHGKFTVVR